MTEHIPEHDTSLIDRRPMTKHLRNKHYSMKRDRWPLSRTTQTPDDADERNEYKRRNRASPPPRGKEKKIMYRSKKSTFSVPFIIRVDFRPIELTRPGAENLPSIRSRSVETAILFFNIDSGPFRNGRRYLAGLNDYRQRSAARPP
ncbi:hypothetical protein EVAR_17441_1 [Eumeta japonica]|uniref:Uncharacterized protein n=1 Tax=Eumeta variegata TaxID=151549 RepID=A0A4C1VAB5_EUMVA|nr:hypothetical protein EVAR_17441_1 [Eumeta japonica]